jgi:hypothetical protein
VLDIYFEMKCYRIREQSRVTFLMRKQIQSEEITHDPLSGRTSISLVLLDGRKILLTRVQTDDEYQLFEPRWERFKTSDELFFDLGDFTRIMAT